MVSVTAGRAPFFSMSEDRPLLEGSRRGANPCPQSVSKRPFKFEMIQRGDSIKPGCWNWRCRREDDAGNVAYGYVLADPLGLAPAPETFEKDRF